MFLMAVMVGGKRTNRCHTLATFFKIKRCYQNNCFFTIVRAKITEKKTVIVKIIANAWGLSAKGTLTFIPKKLATIVGIAKMIVTDVRNFITIFKLLEMTDAYASIVPLRILL